MKIVITGLLLAALAAAQPIISGNTVRFTDASGNLITAGDNTNNALRINCVTGCSSSSSTFGSAVPSSGSAVGFSDGTNLQMGRVVDADTGGGTQYVLMNNLVRRASGGSAELIGQTTMSNSLPVALASDQSALAVTQSGTWNVGQTGTWTVQPGNTANTTPWLVQQNPRNGCGSTQFDSAWAAIPTSLTSVTGTTSCLVAILVTNTNATPQTILIQDGQGSAITIIPTVSIPGQSMVPIPLHSSKATTGIKWQAGGTGLTGSVVAYQ